MRSTFGSYEIARKGLMANRYGTEVASNNIANAATKGFSRRRVHLTTSTPGEVPNNRGRMNQIGNGVDLVGVSRLRSDYSDVAVRRSSSDLKHSEAALNSALALDAVFGEPGETGLSEVFNRFWNSWHEAAKRPDDEGLRAGVLEEGNSLATSINLTARKMDDVGRDALSALQTDVADLNDLISKLADVNQSLAGSMAEIVDPSDMLDERDRILDRMSELINITVSHNEDRTVSVMGGGQWMVDRVFEYPLTLGKNADGTPALTTKNGSVKPKGGSIGGTVDFLSDTLPKARTGFNRVATDLRDRVNAVHTASFTYPGGQPLDPKTPGAAFFVPATGDVDAFTIRVGITTPQGIAVNSQDASGNVLFGEGARLIAGLREKEFTGVDGVVSSITFDYAMLVSSVGRAADDSQRAMDLGELSLEQDLAMRDELSAVNTDEEMLEMMKYEAGYSAAAKVITMIDEMVQTILDIVR